MNILESLPALPNTQVSKELLALNKPKGYLVTRSDDLGRKTVYDLLPEWAFSDGWMPIGRLDLESKGLLLFTTNSKINHALTTPKNCIKVYEIWVRGHVSNEHIEETLNGVQSSQGLLKALEVKKSARVGQKPNFELSLTREKTGISEGFLVHLKIQNLARL